MQKIAGKHGDNERRQIHYIAEWIKHRGLTQADVVRHFQEAGLETNKSTISKWCSGALPSEKNLRCLAAILSVEENDLFHSPMYVYLKRLFRDRANDELGRMIHTLEAAFPRPSLTHPVNSNPSPSETKPGKNKKTPQSVKSKRKTA
jgi:transcriptional regulator with XRE-family HTH domain